MIPKPSTRSGWPLFPRCSRTVFLTGTKLTIGLFTGSLGILSEAAHSGLDLLAAGVTLFAVRASDRPADVDHPYGHGKAENTPPRRDGAALYHLRLDCVRGRAPPNERQAG